MVQVQMHRTAFDLWLQDAKVNCQFLLGFNYPIRVDTFKSRDMLTDIIAYRSALNDKLLMCSIPRIIQELTIIKNHTK